MPPNAALPPRATGLLLGLVTALLLFRLGDAPLIGPDEPIHKGRIAYRAIFSAEYLKGKEIGPSRTKWWGLDRHIVIYYTAADRSGLEDLDAVGQDHGDGVARLQAELAQPVHEPVGRRQQLAGADLSPVRIDQGQVGRLFLGQTPESEGCHRQGAYSRLRSE